MIAYVIVMISVQLKLEEKLGSLARVDLCSGVGGVVIWKIPFCSNFFITISWVSVQKIWTHVMFGILAKLPLPYIPNKIRIYKRNLKDYYNNMLPF